MGGGDAWNALRYYKVRGEKVENRAPKPHQKNQ